MRSGTRVALMLTWPWRTLDRQMPAGSLLLAPGPPLVACRCLAMGRLHTQPALPLLQAYIARLRELSEKQLVLLLAHAFTQHMAGLSGGRILKRLARKHMKLPEDKGVWLALSVHGSVTQLCFTVCVCVTLWPLTHCML